MIGYPNGTPTTCVNRVCKGDESTNDKEDHRSLVMACMRTSISFFKGWITYDKFDLGVEKSTFCLSGRIRERMDLQIIRKQRSRDIVVRLDWGVPDAEITVTSESPTWLWWYSARNLRTRSAFMTAV